MFSKSIVYKENCEQFILRPEKLKSFIFTNVAKSQG